ncbi:MAG TPA: YdhR family protein [Chitinophagaceae bacterium]|nr:YdhR family protein [Chitinophagaceae bacterium]
MTKKIFITKFNYSMTTAELKKIMPEAATEFSKIPGCRWKIWLINEARKEAGGVYLFESAAELEQFLNSKLLSSVKNNPALSNFETNTFSIEEEASAITRAPLQRESINDPQIVNADKL